MTQFSSSLRLVSLLPFVNHNLPLLRLRSPAVVFNNSLIFLSSAHSSSSKRNASRYGVHGDLSGKLNSDLIDSQQSVTPFTVKKAAEYLEVAEITLRRWIKAGKIKYKRVGRNTVFDPDELKAFKKGKV